MSAEANSPNLVSWPRLLPATDLVPPRALAALALILIDLVAFYVMAELVSRNFGSTNIAGKFASAYFAYVPLALLSGAYSPSVVTSGLRALRAAAIASIGGAIMLSLIGFGLGERFLGETLLLAAMCLGSAVLAAPARTLVARMSTVAESDKGYLRAMAYDRWVDCSRSPRTGTFPVRFDPSCATAEDYDRLGRALAGIDRVLVNCSAPLRPQWIDALRGMNVDIEVPVENVDQLESCPMRLVGGKPVVVLSGAPFPLRKRILKRIFDVAFSLAALLFLAPLMALIAIAIKAESKGPVFFRQPRIGQGNRLFHVLKFRSMRAEACDTRGAQSTSRSDNRITRVGNFIRRTSLDELPQLLNVLLGDMSVVGPRPHAVYSTAEGKLFWDADQRYWQRHSSKPGITGLAQVSGYRGATDREVDIINRVTKDIEYTSKWSLRGDIGIILATAKVLVHDNAY